MLLPSRRQVAKVARMLGCEGVHRDGDGWMPCASKEELQRVTGGKSLEPVCLGCEEKAEPASGDVDEPPQRRRRRGRKPVRRQREFEQLGERGVLGIETLEGGGLVSAPVGVKKFNFFARDADFDGRIQEGTPYERAARTLTHRTIGRSGRRDGKPVRERLRDMPFPYPEMYPAGSIAAANQKGAMIAFLPADPQRLAAKVPGALVPVDLHVTVVTLGDDGDEFSNGVRGRVHAGVARELAGVSLGSYRIFAVSEFNANTDDALVAVQIEADDALVALRDRLASIHPVKSDYPNWLPHMTLGYRRDVGQKGYEKLLEHAKGLVGSEVKFPEVLVTFGSNRERYSVGDAAKADPALEGRLVAAQQFAKSLAKTPAPKKDRVFGSDRNREGSASGGGKIDFDQATVEALRSKVRAHNEDMADKPEWARTSLRELKAVYRRGAGAFSVSHRPGMTRNQWAMGRVNAYLKMLRTGRPDSRAYTTDNDLLHRDHPWKKRKR